MKVNLFFCIILVVLFSCQTNQQNKLKSANPISVISISEARALPLGSEVTIQGTVTVASGAFSSSTPYGYALQDNTAGIYIIDSVAPMNAGFKLGEQVLVTGVIQEINNLLAIREKTASIKGTGNEIIPVNVKTGNVYESHEGLVVNTSGIIDSLFSDLPYGYKIFIDDGSGQLVIFVNASASFISDTIYWKVSDRISVTGFLAQYGATYEVEPVMGTDIKVFRNN